MMRRSKLVFVTGLSISRVILSVLFAAVLLLSTMTRTTTLSVCLVILLLAEATDFLDGYFARRFRVTTEWGAMLDPLTDSMTRLIVYWSAAAADLVLGVVPLVMALRDILVAYCRIVMTRFGTTVAARPSGKIKAVVQALGSIAALLGPLYWPITGKWTLHAISWLVIVVTIASAGEYVVGAVVASNGRVEKH